MCLEYMGITRMPSKRKTATPPVKRTAAARKPTGTAAKRNTRPRKSHIARAGEIDDGDEPNLTTKVEDANKKKVMELKEEAEKLAEITDPFNNDSNLSYEESLPLERRLDQIETRIVPALQLERRREQMKWDKAMKDVTRQRRSHLQPKSEEARRRPDPKVKMEEPAETWYDPVEGVRKKPDMWVEFSHYFGPHLKNKMKDWSIEETAKQFNDFSERVRKGELDLNELVRARGANWNRMVGPGMTKGMDQVRPPLGTMKWRWNKAVKEFEDLTGMQRNDLVKDGKLRLTDADLKKAAMVVNKNFFENSFPLHEVMWRVENADEGTKDDDNYLPLFDPEDEDTRAKRLNVTSRRQPSIKKRKLSA
eukprot:jgi/Mesvir1/17731/Mv01477-RA.1